MGDKLPRFAHLLEEILGLFSTMKSHLGVAAGSPLFFGRHSLICFSFYWLIDCVRRMRWWIWKSKDFVYLPLSFDCVCSIFLVWLETLCHSQWSLRYLWFKLDRCIWTFQSSSRYPYLTHFLVVMGLTRGIPRMEAESFSWNQSRQGHVHMGEFV